MFKLKQNYITGNLRMILQDYLDERKERVALNHQILSWTNVTAGVPLIQSLALCSFSSELIIYRKVSIDGTPSPYLRGE